MATYFSIFLVFLTISSGLIWLLDSLIWAPKRKEKVTAICATNNVDISQELVDQVAPLPAIVDNAQQLFPFIALITLFRSFLFEPFQIPSGSMMPTLLEGDFILVNKYSYGIKDPVTRTKLVDVGSPERGDVAVFKYPEDNHLDYIKRIIGLPGDTVTYRNKRFTITPACKNGQSPCPEAISVPVTFQAHGEFEQDIGRGQSVPQTRYTEVLGEVTHDILISRQIPEFKSNYFTQRGKVPGTWVVPDNHYFAVGDNRDNSTDGRYWGFVSDDELVGRASYIWISFEFERLPEDIIPTWVPSGVRFSRVGSII